MQPPNEGVPRETPVAWVSVGTFRLRHPTPPIDYWLFDTPHADSVGPQLVPLVHARVSALWVHGVRYVDFFPTGLNVVGVEAAAEMLRLGMTVRAWYYHERRRRWFTQDNWGRTLWRPNQPVLHAGQEVVSS